MAYDIHNIDVFSDVTPEKFLLEIKPLEKPAVLKGLIRHWPAVSIAQTDPDDLLAYLNSLNPGLAIPHFRCAPECKGRFFYDAGYTSFAYSRETTPAADFFGQLLAEVSAPDPCGLFAGSLALDAYFPGFTTTNTLGALIPSNEPIVSIWIGNRTLTAPHYDNVENIAAVVAGRRKFTLFPIEQFANLYVGPLDYTPAGQPISLVDIRNPDYAAHPRYRAALAHAMTATLEPGDAIYIPTLWWHGVESLDPISAMVNTWWRDVPSYFGSPMNSLLQGVLALRDLPPAQRARWKVVFDALVFETDGPALGHLPQAARGLFGRLTRTTAAQIRSLLAQLPG